MRPDIRSIFLLGPTAVGKTGLAIDLALRLNGEIISADSMQLYQGMDLGTAKPTLAERRGVPHHLFDVLKISEHCDVSRFQTMAFEVMDDIAGRGMVPIVVGGSGMYVRALTRGLFSGPGRDEAMRAGLEGLETSVLRRELEKVDAAAALKIGMNDRRRMIRAIEVFRITGIPISEQQKEWKVEPEEKSKGAGIVFFLHRPREEIYLRCDLRVDRMFELGLVEEVRGLLLKGLAQSPTASKAIGYAEVMRHLAGELALPETIALVKQKTRNFVKRQLSWFKKEPGMVVVELGEGDALQWMMKRLNSG